MMFHCSILSLALMFVSCEAVSWEHTIVKLLKSHYPPYGQQVRPVHYSAKSVPLSVGLNLQSFEFNKDAQLFKANAWLNLNWTDSYLKWNPKKFGGVYSVRLSASDIWTPDLTLYTMNGHHKMNRDALIVVYSTGSVLWVPQFPFTSDCAVSDPSSSKQSCKFKFGSWTYNGNQLDIKANSDKIDTSTLTENPHWKVVSAPAVTNVTYYPCCPEPYPSVTFTLNLKKRN